MARETVMSTPIFDQLLREMAQRAEPRATTSASAGAPPAEATEPAEGERGPAPRRRHRAD
jgi:hypothetical protein